MLSLVPRLAPWPLARIPTVNVSGVWSQMSFAEGIAIDEVSETLLAVGAGATITGGKINATDNTVAVLDQIQPMYLSSTEDFSVEGWFNFSSITAYGGSILTMDMLGTGGTGNRSWLFALLADTTPYFFMSPDGGDNGRKLFKAAPTALNTDNHIAICRVAGMMTLYVNGVIVHQLADNTANYRTTEFMNIRRGAIGKRWGLRVCRGQSAYNGPFTPPTSLPVIVHAKYAADVQADIVFQACMRRNALINEANLSGITLAGGALVQYGRLKTQPVNASRFSSKCGYFGAGEFTIECKVRMPVNPATSESSILGQYGNAFDANSNWLMWTSGGRGIVFYWVEIDGTVRSMSSGSSVLPLNVDAHVVVEKVGTTITMYFDGVSVASAASSKAFIDRSALRPLRNAWDNLSDTANTLSVTNIRIAKRAMYKGVIKPTPTFPKMVNADFIDFVKAGVPATWTTPSSTTTTAGQLRIVPGAYVVVPSSEAYILGAGDFTIDLEFSIQSTQASAGNSSRFTEFMFWSTFASPSQPINYEFHYDHVNSQFTLSAGTASYKTMPFALALNQIYKVQLTREAGRLQLWVDGVKAADVAYAENFQYDVVTPLYIGRRLGGTAGEVVWNSDWTCKTLRLSKKPRSQLTL